MPLKLSAALYAVGIAVLVNLLTLPVSPDLVRDWWWALTALLLVVVYLSVYGFQRSRLTVQRIAACSAGDGRLHLFGVTANGRLLEREHKEGRSWTAWRGHRLDGFKAEDVAAMTATRDILEIYVAGKDGVVRTQRLTRDGWSSWESLSTSATIGPIVAVDAVSGTRGWRELYATGANGKIAHRWRSDDEPWSEWHFAYHQDARDVAVTSPLKDMIEVFAVHRDGSIWHRWFLDRKWSDWESLGRPDGRSPAKAVAAMSGQEKHQEIFVAGTEGDLAHRWHWQGDVWSPWHGFPAPADIADITAAATSQGRLHVTAVDESGGLWQRTYRHDANWSDWERVA